MRCKAGADCTSQTASVEVLRATVREGSLSKQRERNIAMLVTATRFNHSLGRSWATLNTSFDAETAAVGLQTLSEFAQFL